MVSSPSALAKNKKALFDYEVLEILEAGIILAGSEVKSIRRGNVNLKGAHISIASGRPILLGAHIGHYDSNTSQIAYSPDRDRELLLKKKDILRLISKVREKWITLVPIEFYLKWNLIKVKVWLVRGRTKYDKRSLLKERTLEKEARRAMSRHT